MISNHPNYGFFSYDAKRSGCQVLLYRTPEGKEVEVTSVSDDKEAKSYRWKDKVCVGVVTTFIHKVDTNYAFPYIWSWDE